MTCAGAPRHTAHLTDEHEHDHDHDHGSGVLARARHAAAELFGGHSHDTADTVDDALEDDAAGRLALVVSVIGLGLTAALQAVVAVVSQSVALLGDTVHNVTDALTAVPLFVAFALSRRPSSRRFTYGYGRSEDLAGILILVAIAASAGFAAWTAVGRLLNPEPVSHLPAVAFAAVVGFAGNELVARYRIKVGRRIGSAALVADGLHARTDGFTSLAVLLGAAGVALGFPLADPLVGLVITIAIVGVLGGATRQVLGRLMDAVDPDVLAQAEQAVLTVPGVSSVHDLRLRWIGHTLRAEVDLEVDCELTLAQAHEIAHHAEAHLVTQVRHLVAATVQTSPARVAPIG